MMIRPNIQGRLCTAVRAKHMVIDPVEDNLRRSFSTSLSLYDLHTCFNKFLLYYNLPLLSYGKTIQSLIQHIDKHNYNNTVSSITFSVSNTYDETHIYLPNDSLLPNHTVIYPYLLPIFYNLPLRSNPSNPTSILPDLFLNSHTTPQVSTSRQTLRDLHLNICTHNVRGYNTVTKREAWQNYCLHNNIHISCITETKIANSTNLQFYNNNIFTYFWANSESSAEGAAIMIQKHLQPHIHNCQTHPGGAIALDLFFKSEIKLRIIAVYLSSTDMQKRNNTQNTVITWIQQALQHNLHPIILGDFNTHDDICSSSSKFKLINYLHHSNMFDLGAHVDNKHFTWSNNTSHSRIDYIWTDSFNIQFFLSYKLDDSNTSTLSNHSVLISTWTFTNAYSKPSHFHTGISHRIFNYKAMLTDK